MVVIKLNRMAPHTRLERIQPFTNHGQDSFVTVDGLAHGATNEPMAFMLKDQVESSVGS
jgi:hypothetical protein